MIDILEYLTREDVEHLFYMSRQEAALFVQNICSVGEQLAQDIVEIVSWQSVEQMF